MLLVASSDSSFKLSSCKIFSNTLKERMNERKDKTK